MSEDDREALERVSRARTLQDPDKARALYDEWAEQYDGDVYDTLGVYGTGRVAGLCASHAPARTSMSVLDVGCGTGALGQHLNEAGFTIIDGIDISPKMLAIAERRGIYRHTCEADLNQPFTAPAGSYDVIASAGAFVSGHVGAEGFERVFELLNSGGTLSCSITDDVWQCGHFDQVIAGLPACIAFHAIESIAPDTPANAHMLVLTRS